MAKSLERTIRDLYRDKQQPQIDEQVQLDEGAPEEVELEEAKDPSMVNVIQVMGPTKNAVEGVKAIQRVFKVDEKKAKVLLDKAIRHALGEETETELDEISMDVINRYYKMSKQARDKATNSAVATIMRKGDHSKDLKTMDKRTKGIKLAKSRAVARLRGEEVEIQEDGHEDIASAKNKVKIAMSALQKMQGELNKLGDDADLPSWWMGKVAVAVDKIDGMADYLDTQVEDAALVNVAKKLKGASKKHSKQADVIMKHVKDMEEKVLTPAEKKKREEVAQAIERDNPDMPMDKKMAIATATAKKVAEEADLDEGKMKDIVIKQQDKAMGAKPVPAKPKKDEDIERRADVKMVKVKNSDGSVSMKRQRKEIDIGEVSADKLGNYMSKASDASKHRGMPTKKVDNRYTGVARAQDKLAKSGKLGTTAQRTSKARVGASEEVQTEPATNESLFHNYIQKLVKGEV